MSHATDVSNTANKSGDIEVSDPSSMPSDIEMLDASDASDASSMSIDTNMSDNTNTSNTDQTRRLLRLGMLNPLSGTGVNARLGRPCESAKELRLLSKRLTPSASMRRDS